MREMEKVVLRKLHDFLLGEENVELKDGGNVVTVAGGDAKIRVGAIKECIGIVKRGFEGDRKDGFWD